MVLVAGGKALTPEVNRTRRIDLIQALRAIAALMVAAFHLQAAAIDRTDYDGVFRLFGHGEAGVDLFFVISGFIIYYTAQNRNGLTATEFVRARFWRVYPPYWGVLLLYLALAGMASLKPGLVNFSFVVTPRSLLNSTLLLPQPDQILTVAWTLAVEVMFYLLFGLTFFRFGKRGFFAAMAAWAVAAQVFVHSSDLDHPLLGLVLYRGVIEFLFGAIVAVLLLRGQIHRPRLALAIGLLGFSVWLLGGYENLGLDLGREWGAGIPAALILYGIVRSSIRLPGWILLIGEASYILYLIHLLCFSIFGRVLSEVGLDIYSSSIAMLVALLITTALACGATVVLERPFHRWHKARRKRMQRHVEAQSQHPKSSSTSSGRTRLRQLR